MNLAETAYAKINLALHVRSRREDGYHDIETLFAFVDAGDRLTATAAEVDRLTVVGEFAGALDDPFGNIVARALTALPRATGWNVTLEKRLPVAAGLGGGSADAGAIFRMVGAASGLPDNWQERAKRLGADVPACVTSRTAIGTGTGTDLVQIDSNLAGCPVLLVNPRIGLPTGPVFRQWDGVDRGPLPTGSVRMITETGRNDLQAGALSLCPQIGAVLAELETTGAWCVRMSGSGATCFALYETDADRDRADAAIAESHPEWWQMTGNLR